MAPGSSDSVGYRPSPLGTIVLGVNQENEAESHDLVDKALHAFDGVLDTIHDKVLRPLLLAGRAIAYGFIIVLVTILLVSVLVIGLVRFCNIYFFAGRDWLSYVVVGAASLITGLLIWRRRRPVPLREK